MWELFRNVRMIPSYPILSLPFLQKYARVSMCDSKEKKKKINSLLYLLGKRKKKNSLYNFSKILILKSKSLITQRIYREILLVVVFFNLEFYKIQRQP